MHASYAQSREETAFGVKKPSWEMWLPGSWPATSPRHWPRCSQQAPAPLDLPASPGSVYLSQMWLAGGRGGSKGGRSLSSALSYVLPAQEGAGPFLGRTGRWVQRREQGWGDMSNPPPCAAPEEQRRLLQGPPGRICWCFSRHMFCSCLRLLHYFFFFPGIYPKASPGAGGFQHAPGTSIALPSNER